MSPSAQGTAWLLPNPRQSHSSSLGYPGLSQLLSRRETPRNSPCVQLYQGDRIWQHSVEQCLGLTTILPCPKHPGQSPRQLPGLLEESRAQPVNDFSKPSSSQQLPQKQQSHKSPWRVQPPPPHTLLPLKVSLSASSEPWALILAASAVPKCSGQPRSPWQLCWPRAERTMAQGRNRARAQVGATVLIWSHTRSLHHHQALL